MELKEQGTLDIEAAGQENIEKFLTFSLSKEEYAVPIRLVQEVIRLAGVSITRVPRAEEYIAGIMNLRGRVIPLVDLPEKLRLISEAQEAAKRVIVVNINDRTMGLIVDSVREVINLDSQAIEALPEIALNSIDTNFLTGIGRVDEKIISLLDLEKVIPQEGGISDGRD